MLSASRGDAAQIAGAVLDDVLRFQRGAAFDDIAIVAVQAPGRAIRGYLNTELTRPGRRVPSNEIAGSDAVGMSTNP